jgi:Uma2 family endonuclease
MTSTEALPPPAVSVPPHPPLATFEAFLAWAVREEARAEWVAGEVVPMMPGSIAHQRVLDFINGGETYINGPADLVVEIVSPESDARDRGDKFVEYEAAGIPEYWLIDLVRREADLYHLDAESRYRRIAPDAAGVYESVLLPGLRLKPDWLWRQPVPTLEVRLGRSRRATRRATAHSAMRRAR